MLKLSVLFGVVFSSVVYGSTVGTYTCERDIKLRFNDTNVTIFHKNIDTLEKTRNLFRMSNAMKKSNEKPNIYLYVKHESDSEIVLWSKITGMGHNSSDKKATVLKKLDGAIIMKDKNDDMKCIKSH